MSNQRLVSTNQETLQESINISEQIRFQRLSRHFAHESAHPF